MTGKQLRLFYIYVMIRKQLGLLYMYDKETGGTVLHVWQGNGWDCSTCMTVMIRKQLGLF